MKETSKNINNKTMALSTSTEKSFNKRDKGQETSKWSWKSLQIMRQYYICEGRTYGRKEGMMYKDTL